MRPKVIILGGGYAGLATLVALHERCPGADMTWVDPHSAHIKRTRLHELIRHPGGRCQIPFRDFERRFGCRHLQAEIQFNEENLENWQNSKTLLLDGQRLAFDYLVIATGSRPCSLPVLGAALTPDDLIRVDFTAYLRRRLSDYEKEDAWITVVGAGASGIQILFELDAWRRQWRNIHARAYGLRLVDAGQVVLAQFPRRMRQYAAQKISKAGIQYLDQTLLRECRENQVRLEHRISGEKQTLPSVLTMVCLGLVANPRTIQVNPFGQVVQGGRVLECLFAAGDCTVFAGGGANSLSAQVATHKGRLVGENIVRHRHGLTLTPYRFREMGYFVSMGPADGVGWLGIPENVVAGLPAFFIKEAVETLYEFSIH
ncbi:MAG: NAD(P)/FAD-dependent oxidoreductase [Methylohalobius sp. ZOD2]